MGEFNDRPLDRVEEQLERLARFLVGRAQPPKSVATHPFDVRYGTDTSGWVNRRRLRGSHPNSANISAYFGTPPSRFINAIERWRATPDSPSPELCRFVDLGCGKGRVLLLASRMPFREAIGVELNPRLAGIASANLDRWRKQQEITTPTSVCCADAVSSVKTLLDGPTLLYLYHPFTPSVLRELLKAVVPQQAALTAPVDLLYLFPVPDVQATFSDFPQFQPMWCEEIPASPEDQADGVSTATDLCILYRLMPTAVRSAAADAPASGGIGM
jgi:SAM-dependent methyltransferase